jgi:hypothetical protein
MIDDLQILFRENYKLFQFAYQYKNVIWTHAGIHKGWWKYYAEPHLKGKKENRFAPFVVNCENVADKLNLMFEFNCEALFMVGHHRGGYDKVGGPIWTDKREIYDNPLPGYHQVVGHNPVKFVQTYIFKEGTKITFCDCLTKGHWYTFEI